MAAAARHSMVFTALADPTRPEIIARLAGLDATVTELAEPFSISLPAISRHLKVLRPSECAPAPGPARHQAFFTKLDSLLRRSE